MVIDSSVFIEYLRAKDRTKTTLVNLPSEVVFYVSAATVFELCSGATDPQKHADVRKLLQDVLILPINAAVGEKSGEIFRYLRRNGQMIEVADIFIAATALLHNLPVKTLNKRHFERIEGLILL